MGLPACSTLPARRPSHPLRRTAALLTTAALALATVFASVVPAQAANPVTPGDFTGYGFDQCVAPTQAAMSTWLQYSPYRAVGIYISGDSRACINQPNLNPTWISTQLAAGWRLLPISLGPQASCSTREKYLNQVRINPATAGDYAAARAQGSAEADKTVTAATALGISPGSTMWYDIEAFSISNAACRDSAMGFLSGWTLRLHQLGFVSGVYSSAASGITMMANAATATPTRFAQPDQIWIADWNGVADTHTSYIADALWGGRQRVHQYKGGHNETYGGVTINIDSNYLDLKGAAAAAPTPAAPVCGGVRVDLPRYRTLTPGSRRTVPTKALQCLLKQQGLFKTTINGKYGKGTIAAARAYQRRSRLPVSSTWNSRDWISLLSKGAHRTVKPGASGNHVRRAQRALTASGVARLTVTGTANTQTMNAVGRYQKRVGQRPSGVLGASTWTAMNRGRS